MGFPKECHTAFAFFYFRGGFFFKLGKKWTSPPYNYWISCLKTCETNVVIVLCVIKYSVFSHIYNMVFSICLSTAEVYTLHTYCTYTQRCQNVAISTVTRGFTLNAYWLCHWRCFAILLSYPGSCGSMPRSHGRLCIPGKKMRSVGRGKVTSKICFSCFFCFFFDWWQSRTE